MSRSPGARRSTDILLLSLGTTIGLRAGDEALASMIRQTGASVELVEVRIGAAGALRRAYPVTDLVEALAARRALAGALRRLTPRAVIFSSTTSSLLAPRLAVPYAVRLDAPARLNRPGRRNAIQHALERRRLHAATLVLPFSEMAAQALPKAAAPAVVLPQPIAPSAPAVVPPQPIAPSAPAVVPPQPIAPSTPSAATGPARERLVVAYTPDPKAKGLDIVARAWAAAALPGAELDVFGIAPELARRHLARHGIEEPAGVRWRGRVPAQEFRATLRRARAFLTAARWEDFGFAQLEALADGALLVCAATGGPFEALVHARRLAPALCTQDFRPEPLAAALQQAFQMPEPELARYRAAAAEIMTGYEPQAVAALIAEQVLPALLG